jgi:hypothetical protein
LSASTAVSIVPCPCEHDDRDEGVDLLGLAENLQPSRIGHDQVGDHEVVLAFAQHLEPRFAARGDVARVSDNSSASAVLSAWFLSSSTIRIAPFEPESCFCDSLGSDMTELVVVISAWAPWEDRC